MSSTASNTSARWRSAPRSTWSGARSTAAPTWASRCSRCWSPPTRRASAPTASGTRSEMRATFSPSVSFDNVRVPAEAVLGEPGAATRAGVIEIFALGYAAVYLGVAERVLAFAIDYAKRRIVKPENVPVAHEPAVQRHVGELPPTWTRPCSCSPIGGDLGPGRHARARRPRQPGHYLATEVGLEVTSTAIQFVGGRGAYKDYPAERAFPGVRTSTLMSPTMDRRLEAIGKRPAASTPRCSISPARPRADPDLPNAGPSLPVADRSLPFMRASNLTAQRLTVRESSQLLKGSGPSKHPTAAARASLYVSVRRARRSGRPVLPRSIGPIDKVNLLSRSSFARRSTIRCFPPN